MTQTVLHHVLTDRAAQTPSQGSWLAAAGSWLTDLLRDYLTDPLGAFHGLLDTAVALLTAAARVASVPAVVLVVGWVVAAPRVRAWRAARLADGARWVQVLPPPQVNREGAAQVWSALHTALQQAPRRRRLYGPQHVAWELHWGDGGAVRFGIWVPGTVAPGLVERAVEGAWPGARTITHNPPPDPIREGQMVEGGQLRLGQPGRYPLAVDLDADPLRVLLSAASGPEPGETATVQVLLRPAAMSRMRRLLDDAYRIRTGQPLTALGRFLDLFTAGPVVDSAAMQRPQVANDVAAVKAKAAGLPGWEAVVRYAVATPTAATRPRGLPGRMRQRRGQRDRLRGRAHTLASSFGVFQGRNHLRRRPLADAHPVLAARRLGRGDLLSLPEVAALAHLPGDALAAGVTHAGARAAAPRPHIPERGRVLGDADAGPPRPVALAIPDARHHVHVMGATGSGKSTLLANLILQDVAAGRGVVLVEPKGDLVVDLLDRLPAHAADRLVLIDPQDAAAPPTLNMLEGPDPAAAVEHVVTVFRDVFSTSWGPRLDDILRAACHTLLAADLHGATIAEIPRLLTDPTYRAGKIAAIPASQTTLHEFWGWYERLSGSAEAAATAPVLSRLRQVLTRPFMADVLSSSASSFDMGAVLDGGILLARVPKGILGAESARLLGSFLVSRTWQAALARSAQPERSRVDAALYVDEAHNFLSVPSGFEELFAEARGYRLSLVLAHQHLSQLPAELRAAVAANARTKVWFTTSPEDARALERHTLPVLAAHDLAHLGRYQAAARLVVDGIEAPACTIAARPAPPPTPGRAILLRDTARARHGRDAGERADQRVGRATATVPGQAWRATPLAAAPSGSAAGRSSRPGTRGDGTARFVVVTDPAAGSGAESGADPTADLRSGGAVAAKPLVGGLLHAAVLSMTRSWRRNG